MAETALQTRSTHVRFDPSFHFFLLPALFALLLWTTVHAFQFPSAEAIMLPVLVLLILLMSIKARTYALKVQDRVIRLEERLRLSSLLSGPLASRIRDLTESQLIALRFASDREVPALVERALDESLTNAQIKEAIQEWRPDYWRV